MAGLYDRKDHLYNKAKEEGYLSRASYKLIELNQRFKLFQPGMRVLDLGAWPGGWLQVASKKVTGSGLVFGIDLVEIDAVKLDNVKTITGDVRDIESFEEVSNFSPGSFDLVMSDMSPKLTGIKSVDQIASVGCAELALWVSQRYLKVRGVLVIKVFKGNETENFLREMRPLFDKVIRAELKSTRKTSNEFYIVGQGLKADRDR